MPRDSIACSTQRRQGMALNNMFCHINQLFEFQSRTFNSTNAVSSAAYDIHIIKWYLALISSNICYHPWYAQAGLCFAVVIYHQGKKECGSPQYLFDIKIGMIILFKNCLNMSLTHFQESQCNKSCVHLMSDSNCHKSLQNPIGTWLIQIAKTFGFQGHHGLLCAAPMWAFKTDRSV